MSQHEVTAGDLMSFMVATQTIQRYDSVDVAFLLLFIITIITFGIFMYSFCCKFRMFSVNCVLCDRDGIH